LPDLDAFAKILIDKGFNDYFQTQVAYPGKLKDSITEYMEACSNGKESLIETEPFYYRLICNGQEMIIRVLYAIFG
jgi:hypothetical protein